MGAHTMENIDAGHMNKQIQRWYIGDSTFILKPPVSRLNPQA